MSDLLNVKLQEIRANGSNYLRYKGRDGEYHYIDSLPTPDTDAVGVTWAQLKEMRDGGKLEIGQFYRITDYATTTVQENTRSAGHQFDVVVMALDSKTLAERAWALPHKGDTYFKDSKLEAWQLWYCLDNDVARFMWADGGGFKIEDNDTAFRRNPSSDTGYFYGWTDGETLLFTNTLYPAVGTQTYDDQFFPADKVKEVVDGGKGVIYRMIDEFFNDCPYDFKNIQFKRWAVSNVTNEKLDPDSLEEMEAWFVYDADDNPFCYARQDSDYTDGTTSFVVDDEVSEWYYTFSVYDEDGAVGDYSLHVYGYCEENMAVAQRNSMLPAQDCDDNGIYYYSLNNNVFIDKYDEEESWYTMCFGNAMKENCSYNTFSANCYGNAFSAYCQNNSFSANCFNNSFSADCCNNSFSAGCNQNSFSASCSRNAFSANCFNNSFSADCTNNTFSAYCRFNSFSAYCSGNSFSANVQSCTFAKSYTRYVIIECGNVGITLTSNKTTSYSSYLQNILISLGTNVSGNKTISHNSVDDDFKTTYQNSNSDVVDI